MTAMSGNIEGFEMELDGQLGRGHMDPDALPESKSRQYEPKMVAAMPIRPDAATGTERVLVVEDDAAVRSLVVRILRRHGFGVLEAPDGETALDLLRATDTDVDLLITDAHMPGMGGPELIDAAQAVLPKLRALLISGSPEEASGSGAPYLAKPFTAAQLLHRVREILDA